MSDKLRAYARTAVKDVEEPLHANAPTGVAGDVLTPAERLGESQGIEAGR